MLLTVFLLVFVEVCFFVVETGADDVLLSLDVLVPLLVPAESPLLLLESPDPPAVPVADTTGVLETAPGGCTSCCTNAAKEFCPFSVAVTVMLYHQFGLRPVMV